MNIKNLGKDALYSYYMFKRPKSPKDVKGFHLYIETTNKCNYKCIMCAGNDNILKRKKGFMDLKLFKRVIDKAKSIGIKYVIPHIWGEPLLHPDIVEMVRYAKKAGMRVEITTNGYLLSPKTSRGLLMAGLDHLIVSFHGMTPESYEKIHGVNGFDRVINNVKAFYRMRKASGTTLKIHTTTMKANHKEIHKVYQIFNRIADDFNVTDCDYNMFDNKTDCRVAKTEIHRKKPCYELWSSLAVSWDGKIGVCCGDNSFSLKVGDMKSGLLAAFNSEDLDGFRILHRKGDYMPVCWNCVGVVK